MEKTNQKIIQKMMKVRERGGRMERVLAPLVLLFAVLSISFLVLYVVTTTREQNRRIQQIELNQQNQLRMLTEIQMREEKRQMEKLMNVGAEGERLRSLEKGFEVFQIISEYIESTFPEPTSTSSSSYYYTYYMIYYLMLTEIITTVWSGLRKVVKLFIVLFGVHYFCVIMLNTE